jgi:hypothetical protein
MTRLARLAVVLGLVLLARPVAARLSVGPETSR